MNQAPFPAVVLLTDQAGLDQAFLRHVIEDVVRGEQAEQQRQVVVVAGNAPDDAVEFDAGPDHRPAGGLGLRHQVTAVLP